MKNPKINYIAFQCNNRKNNIFNIYIVSRKYNKFQLDHIIEIKPEKVNLKKYFPKFYFISKYPKNRILLKDILKFNKKR